MKINCLHCNKETTNPKYCSRSCAAINTNKQYPKRKAKIKEWRCKTCNIIIGIRRQVCDICNPFIKNWNKILYKDIVSIRKYQKNSRIRDLARTIYKKSNKPKYCIVCGYNVHYEICHIKSISSHSDDTTVGEINSLDNLVALCPNHHWEFDNNRLKLPHTGVAPVVNPLEEDFPTPGNMGLM